MTGLPAVVVPYDSGAAHPIEVAAAFTGVARVVFAAASSAHTARLLPVLRHLGPVVELPEDASQATAQLRAYAPAGIVTFSEQMIPSSSVMASDLGLAYHDEATTRRLTDKYAQRQCLRAAGIDATTCVSLRRVEDLAEALALVRLPAILKPARGGASRDTRLVTHVAEAAELLDTALAGADRLLGMVLEERIVGVPVAEGLGNFVSIESIVAAGSVSHVAITGKFPQIPPFRELGNFYPAVLPPGQRDAVLALAGKAVMALDVRDGVVHTEVMFTERGPRLIEVNGRLGGYINELLMRAGGGNLITAAARLALGEEPTVQPPSPDGVFWEFRAPAPVRPGRFVEGLGWRTALALPGVTRYVPYLRPGDPIPGGVQTTPLDLICGRATSHAEMLSQVAAACAALSYRLEIDGIERVWTADELVGGLE